MAHNQQQQQQLSQEAQQNSHNLNCYTDAIGSNNSQEIIGSLANQSSSQVVVVQHGQFTNKPSVTPPSWVH